MPRACSFQMTGAKPAASTSAPSDFRRLVLPAPSGRSAMVTKTTVKGVEREVSGMGEAAVPHEKPHRPSAVKCPLGRRKHFLDSDALLTFPPFRSLWTCVLLCLQNRCRYEHRADRGPNHGADDRKRRRADP